jgi:hypothetical protein
MDLLALILGVFSIVVGIVGKDFHAADVLSGVGYKQKSSRWSGRLIFILVGVFFLADGILGLIRGR